jgi:hypothetical protein
MAKKTLNEAVVRRFQKLANVAPLNEMYNEYNMKEEEEADLAPVGDEAGEENIDAPEGEEMDMGGEDELELTQGEIQAIADALPALQAIASAADGEEEGDMDMDAEEPMALDASDEAGAEDEDAAADAIMEALEGISYQPSQSEIVNEVAQRVARRLQAAKLHEAKLNKALGRK